VELLELDHNQMLMAISAVSFMVGALLMRAFSKPRQKESASEDPRNHQIREMEADLRTVRRQSAECEMALDNKIEEFDTAVTTMQELRATLAEREEEFNHLKSELKGSVSKTRELRTELQDRATETIREHVRAQEAETELEVARAGSEAVLSEISRLQEEQKNMTDTMRRLEDQMLPDEELFGDDAHKDS
jgi:chromosome segregation ATPase